MLCSFMLELSFKNIQKFICNKRALLFIKRFIMIFLILKQRPSANSFLAFFYQFRYSMWKILADHWRLRRFRLILFHRFRNLASIYILFFSVFFVGSFFFSGDRPFFSKKLLIYFLLEKIIQICNNFPFISPLKADVWVFLFL